jgi:L-alanine-DL-glutamate epimerase-like enolase superfamily enzyme
VDGGVTSVSVRAYTIPTDGPEADGTLSWDRTTIVLVRVTAEGEVGLGYTYAAPAAAALVRDHFADVLHGRSVMDLPAIRNALLRVVRNLGAVGQVSYALSAVDTALWDLKAKLLKVPLAALMGVACASMPVYGSGGFTTYDADAIRRQIDQWRAQGITMAKIKIGTHPEHDVARVEAARSALGEDDQLFVDANGAYSAKQALEFAAKFQAYRVSWFEEPVTSDNLEGLHLIRHAGPPGMDITAGEYGDSPFYMRRMLAAEAVDVLQIDATRCQGYSGFMHASSLAAAANIPISSHCAPALHLPVCCHAGARHMEYFYDHARIERMIFDGVPEVKQGALTPDLSRPGHGLILKAADAERYAI